MRKPAEGDLYKIYQIDNHLLEVRYGYYSDNERGSEPLPVFPDFSERQLYTRDGRPIVSILHAVCSHCIKREDQEHEDFCGSCVYYPSWQEEIAICQCEQRRRIDPGPYTWARRNE